MKRIIALLLVAVTLLAFASCGEEAKANYVIKAGDTELAVGAYYSELYTYKNDFLFNFLGLTEDNPAIWSQDSPSGRLETVGETLSRMALEDVVQFAWVIEYAKDNGAVLSEDDRTTLEEGFNTLLKNFENAEDYNKYLDTLKFTEEEMKEYLEQTLYYDKGFGMLIGENGLYPLAEDVYDKYYEENFYSVKHIFVNDVSKTDEEGKDVELTEEEKKAQVEKADKIYDDLKSGTDFETLYMLSEDGMSTSYPDGLTFTSGMIDQSYEEAVKKLKPGEYTKVNGDYGGIYIVMRTDLLESGREEYDSMIRDAVHSEIQSRIYTDHKKEVTVNYDLINTFKFEDVPVSGQ